MTQLVGVIGAGQMGAGIAQVFAQIGKQVKVVDLNEKQIERAKATIQKSAEKLCQKGKIDASAKLNTSSLIDFSTSLKDLSKCDLVIEAVNENKDLKKTLLVEMETILSPSQIIASNTSSISITELGSSLKHPDRFIGMHFMNPVPLMKLVEIIPGLATSDETLSTTKSLVENLGKESVTSRDFPGFVVNRILMPMINEAFCALAESTSTAPEIDLGMKLGTNQPMGPLQLADFIGLDTCLSIMNVLYDGFKDPRYRPSPLLVQHVNAGWLGRKTGRGVYKY